MKFNIDGGDAITEFNKSNNWLDDKGIYHIIFSTNVHINIDDLKIDLDAYKLATNDLIPPAMIDLSGVLSITPEGRQFISKEIAKIGIPATALIVKSRMSRLIGSFFIGINKPNFPVKLFHDEHKAVEWLDNFLHE